MAQLAYLRHRDNLVRRAQILVSSPDSDYPAENAQALPVNTPARCGFAAQMKWRLTFQGSVSADLVALCGHNLSTSATVKVYAGSTYDPSTLVATLTWRRRTMVYLWSSTQSAKFWTIQIEDDANEYGFSQIGYLMLGMKTLIGCSFVEPWTRTHRFTNVGQRSETGLLLVTPLTDVEGLEATFRHIDETAANGLRTLWTDCGRDSEPMLVIPDADENDGFLGRLTEDLSQQFSASKAGLGASSHRLSVQARWLEDPACRIVQDPLPTLAAGAALPSGSTFSRASTAYYRDSTLTLVQAAAAELRDGHFDAYGVKGILIEPARTNEWSYSEDLSNANWTTPETSVTANATTAPNGTATADKLYEDATTATHYLSRSTGTFTSGSPQSCSVYLKAAGRTAARFYLTNTEYFGVRVDLTAGTISSYTGSGGTLLHSRIVPLGNGWFRIEITGTLGTKTTATAALMLENATGATNYAGDGSSGLYVWGFQFEKDAGYSSSYIPTTTAAASRAADRLQIPWPVALFEPLTAYLEAVEIGGRYKGSAATIWQLGQDGVAANPRAALYANASGNYAFRHEPSASNVEATRTGSALGTRIEVRAVLYPDGAVLLGLSVNGGAESASSKSSALALSSAAPDALQIGANTNQAEDASVLIQRLKFHRGAQTLAFMRAL